MGSDIICNCWQKQQRNNRQEQQTINKYKKKK